MKVLIYYESYYDSHGIAFVAANIQAAFKKLIQRQHELLEVRQRMIDELNMNNVYYERHLSIHEGNLEAEKTKLKELEEYISSKEWNDETILEFTFEDHYFFDWYEVDE